MTVALRVFSRGVETVERFNEQTKIETSKWLEVISDGLPVGAQVSATDLASIGPQCAKCDIRPLCPAYRNAVCELWQRDDTPFELPLDTAGTVVEVREQGSGYFSVKMIDCAGRTVNIHRLSRERARDVTLGEPVWFFDLASIEARTPSPGWHHPRNFHEVAMLQTERTAWTLRVFSSGVQA